MGQKKLLLAGSHAGATAIAVIKIIRQRGLPWEINWIGRKWATEEKKSHTLEFNSLPKLGVKFYSLESGKVQTKYTKHTISALLTIPFGFFSALYHLIKIRPDLILTFGGAAGAEISFWGRVLRIPIIVHEQTATAGRANIFSSRFAKLTLLSRDSSEKFFKGRKTEIVGNPINPAIAQNKGRLKTIPETLFITGGSRGSRWINDGVKPILGNLLDRYRVVLQCGEENISTFKHSDSKFKVYGQIPFDDWPRILVDADIVVSRAGANIVSELIALKKPCVLIPIPWSYLDEQQKNAEYARDFGIAKILPQKELTPQSLEGEIEKLRVEYPKIVEGVKNKVSPDVKASDKLVDVLERYA
jgi:UDP-N-acetylglucosamine--N-acetylmuramyl-(pentapeptide) pyrophosphoryl-undecaprenol N-acetylglucosamine transferase